MIDDVDLQIIQMLQGNGRISNADIARNVGMAPSAVLERIRKLEERRVIRGYTALLDPKALDVDLLAYVLVRTDSGGWQRETAERLAAFPEVQEVHHIAGEDCFLVKVRCRDTAALGALLRERFQSLGTVRSTRTTIVLETVKESMTLDLKNAAKEG